MSLIDVQIGDKYMYKDYGFALLSKSISFPEPTTNYVEVPTRDGSLDFSEALTGAVHYKDRSISMDFFIPSTGSDRLSAVQTLANIFHGQKVRLQFTDDPNYYYVARLTVETPTTKKTETDITVSGIADPFRYYIIDTDEDDLWDPFSFEDGIVNDLSGIVVNGTEEVTLIGRAKNTAPKITVTDIGDSLTVTFGGSTYVLVEGTQSMYEIVLTEGENVLTFTGNGTVAIKSRGGIL